MCIIVVMPYHYLFVFVLSLPLSSCGRDASPAEPSPGPRPVIYRTQIPSVPAGVDVLEHLARHPTGYRDGRLEWAENALSDSVARPWSVERLREVYERLSVPDTAPRQAGDWNPVGAAHDVTKRAALIYLLGASRAPGVLPLVGAALKDEQLDVRVNATEVIMTYWSGVAVVGGLEASMTAAAAWWDANR